MLELLSHPFLVGASVIILSNILTFLITKKFVLLKLEVYKNLATAKAKTIENEAELLLHKSQLKIQELELESRRDLEVELSTARSTLDARYSEIERTKGQKLMEFKIREEKIRYKERLAGQEIQRISREINFNAKQKEKNKMEQDKLIKLLEKQAHMTATEAVNQLIEEVKTNKRAKLSIEISKLEKQTKQEFKRKAHFILAQATTRFAGEFAQERLANRVFLPDDELKGRIIGKEGRNIKILENLLGVDIIIDETPNVIELSSHNLLRRSIATKTINLLVEDGRIQPTRIEDIFQKVTQEFESNLLDEGEVIIAELGLTDMHPELIKMIAKLRYRASYGQNALTHTLEVAHFSALIAAELGGNELLAKRAGLLHDIGKAMTHEIGGNHVDIGADICHQYHEDDVVINAIYAHHDKAEVESIECAAVCAADALSAARPGARRKVLENYIKRVKDIEEIALAHNGIKQAYAINAGREVRVIVNAELLNGAESSLISSEIATKIEQSMSFPGEIKVHVIREERFVAIAQ